MIFDRVRPLQRNDINVGATGETLTLIAICILVSQKVGVRERADRRRFDLMPELRCE